MRKLPIISILLVAVSTPNATAGPCTWLKEKIYTGTLADRNFRTDRDIPEYLELGPSFEQSLAKVIKEGGHWLDAGAGSALAMQNVMTGSSKFGSTSDRLLGTAVSLKLPTQREVNYERVPYNASEAHARLSEQTGGRFRSLLGEVGKMSDTILAKNQSVDIITDYMGPFSYTLDIAAVLNQYLRLLKVGGSIHIVSVEWAMYAEIAGKRVDFISYLNTLPGISATTTFYRGNTGFEIKKSLESAEVPQTVMDMKRFRSRNPPVRYFSVKEP